MITFISNAEIKNTSWLQKRTDEKLTSGRRYIPVGFNGNAIQPTAKPLRHLAPQIVLTHTKFTSSFNHAEGKYPYEYTKEKLRWHYQK